MLGCIRPGTFGIGACEDKLQNHLAYLPYTLNRTFTMGLYTESVKRVSNTSFERSFLIILNIATKTPKEIPSGLLFISEKLYIIYINVHERQIWIYTKTIWVM